MAAGKEEGSVSLVQGENFIAILRAACGNGKLPLKNPDWDCLADWARSQSLAALFYTGATQYQEFFNWEKKGQQRLQQETIATVVSQSTRTQLFLELYQQLLEAKLHPVVLKGILVRRLYGPLADYRPSCDEDLYVLPEEAARCRKVLEKNGFQVTTPVDLRQLSDPHQEVSMDGGDGLLHLELHPQFFEQSREDLKLSDGYFRDSHEQKISVEVGGVPLWTLDETRHYLYLFLHLAKHFKGAGVGIRQVMDLMIFDRVCGEKIDWNVIRRAAEELHCGSLYGDVAALGKKLGFSPTELFPSYNPELLLADSLEGGVYGHSSAARSYGSIVTGSALNGDGKERLLRTIFPTFEYMTRSWPVLKQRPWLLPIGYGRRFYKFFIQRRHGPVALPAIQKGKERSNLLRSYGILPSRNKGRR